MRWWILHHALSCWVVKRAAGRPKTARLLSRMTLKSWTELGLAEGQNIYAQVKYVSLSAGRGEV